MHPTAPVRQFAGPCCKSTVADLGLTKDTMFAQRIVRRRSGTPGTRSVDSAGHESQNPGGVDKRDTSRSPGQETGGGNSPRTRTGLRFAPPPDDRRRIILEIPHRNPATPAATQHGTPDAERSQPPSKPDSEAGVHGPADGASYPPLRPRRSTEPCPSFAPPQDLVTPRGPLVPDQAGDGTRTRDPQLGKLMLYQLSYSRPFAHRRQRVVRDQSGCTGTRNLPLPRAICAALTGGSPPPGSTRPRSRHSSSQPGTPPCCPDPGPPHEHRPRQPRHHRPH